MGLRILQGLLVIAGLSILVLGFLPQYFLPQSRDPARHRADDRECRSNLKSIGSAMEMYLTDSGADHATSLAQLTPNYLKSLPDCPNGSVYRLKSSGSHFTVSCKSGAHIERRRRYFGFIPLLWTPADRPIPSGYPLYAAGKGVIVSPKE